VDNLERLLGKYAESEQVKRIFSGLESGQSSRLLVSGMMGAQDCFVLASIFSAKPYSHLIVAEDKEEAAYLQNTLDKLIEKQTVLFFPDSFRRPGLFEELDNNNVLIRTESINKLSAGYHKNEIMVTYPEAIFEKVVDPSHLESQKIHITKSEDLDVDTITEFLVEYGFERTDFVYEPGQFAIRGGIIDIFSFGNEWPYRVELFDEEVESIRLFNPTTQLSLKNIERVSIIPNVSNRFSQDQKVSLFKVFPETACLWIKDVDMLLEKLAIAKEKAEVFAEQVKFSDDEDLKKILDDRAFIYPENLIAEMDGLDILLYKQGTRAIEVSEEIKFNAKPQPTFNKNFKILMILRWPSTQTIRYSNVFIVIN